LLSERIQSADSSRRDRINHFRDWLAQAPEDEFTNWRRLMLAECAVRARAQSKLKDLNEPDDD